MEITSDDQFEELTQNHDNKNIVEVQQSLIRAPAQLNSFRVEIIEVQNSSELGIVQNQYYYVKVFKNDKPYQSGQPIKRRFSDFDMLFEIIFRNYKGKILPGFPQKGLVSYVKTKVTLVKDNDYLKNRTRMVERFMTKILNEPQLSCEVCEETKRFLSEKEFDLFKKTQKQNSTGVISSSWNKLKNYINFGKENKYKCVSDSLIEKKKDFESFYEMAKTALFLLQQQANDCNSYSKNEFKIDKYAQYCVRANKITKKQKKNSEVLRQLVFELFSLNEDFLMVLKIIQNIEELRNNEDNCKKLKKVEETFKNEQPKFEERKKIEFERVKIKLVDVLKDIQKIDQSF